MHIFMIARGFPTKDDPQWGCFEKDQAEALVALGHRATVLCVDTRFRLKWRKLGMTEQVVNGVHYYNSFWAPAAIIKLLGGFPMVDKLKETQLWRIYNKAIRQDGMPDVLYGQFFFNTALALTIRERTGVPVVGIEHAARFNAKQLDAETQRIATKVYSNIDAAVVVAQSLQESLKRHFGIDSAIVHNMAGKEFFYQPKAVKDGRLHYIATGSLIHRKGFDLLVKAFAKADLDKACWKLDIVGGGPERGKLQKMIDEAGLSANITLVGQHTKTEIAAMLQQSDVFVLPSRNENFSVAVLEALACGLPVIASICGGIRECIDERNGLLFPVDDVDMLTKALQQMQESHNKYDRQHIANDCQKRFSPEVIAQQLTQVFEDVLAKK